MSASDWNTIPPARVRVGTSLFPINIVEHYPADFTDNDYGATDLPTETIYIKSTQSEGQAKDTVLHEVLHAIRSRACISVSDEVEERLIRQFAPWILLVLQENPQLVKYLAEKVK